MHNNQAAYPGPTHGLSHSVEPERWLVRYDNNNGRKKIMPNGKIEQAICLYLY